MALPDVASRAQVRGSRTLRFSRKGHPTQFSRTAGAAPLPPLRARSERTATSAAGTGLRLVDAFAVLVGRIGIVEDSSAGLDIIGRPHPRRTQRDAGVHFAARAEIADAPAWIPRLSFSSSSMISIARTFGAAETVPAESRPTGGDDIEVRPQLAFDIGDECMTWL